MRHPDIPKWSYQLFKGFCHGDFFEELQGDLEENFIENKQLFSLKKARSIYRKEVLKMIRPSVFKQLKILSFKMSHLPKNYLKTSIRAIKLNPFYVFANIFGLALALSICTIGYFNYRFNSSFNTYFEKANNLYKIHGLRTSDRTVGTSAIPLVDALKTSDIPAMRYTRETIPVRLQKKLFNESVGFADNEFYQFFEFKNLNGNPISAPDNNEIIISARTALKLFNEPYPVGDLVYLVFPNQNEVSFVVKDVFENPPTNTSFFHSIMISLDNYFESYDIDRNDWSQWVDGSFVYATKNELPRIEGILNDFKDIQNASNPQLEISKFTLDNVLDWPRMESSLYAGRFREHLHSSSVMGITGSAIAILLLACFNFINTSIALSGKRLKEVAVRKIMGGNRKSTIFQFMLENALMISFAVMLSYLISLLLIPSYNALFQRELIQMDKIPFGEILTFSVILISIVTILSGAYPAFHVSRFAPIAIFREKVALSGKNRLMSVLLTFQFSLCFYNMAGLFILIDNAKYQDTLDRGYGLENVVNVPLNRPEQFDELRDLISQNSEVTSVAGTSSLIGFTSEERNVAHEGVEYFAALLNVGSEYPKTLGLRLSKGSFFSNANAPKDEIIINQMLEDELGIDLLNQVIKVGDENLKVIGIVDDFNLRPIMMSNRIVPTIIKLSDKTDFRYASIQTSGNIENANEFVEATWYDLFPRELYNGFYQKDVMDNVTETNKIMIIINVFLGVISILISVLGLYTLVALTVQRRSKEFGVRKVLGASRNVIIGLLGRNLYWILGISSVMGLASAYVILKTVMDIIYAYHIDANIIHFTKAVLSVLFIVVVAVGYKMWQTGKLNPVQQLRTE